MRTTRRQTLKLFAAGALAGAVPAVYSGPAAAQSNKRIAMVVKALGIGFFDACRNGGQEAAKESAASS